MKQGQCLNETIIIVYVNPRQHYILQSKRNARISNETPQRI